MQPRKILAGSYQPRNSRNHKEISPAASGLGLTRVLVRDGLAGFESKGEHSRPDVHFEILLFVDRRTRTRLCGGLGDGYFDDERRLDSNAVFSSMPCR